MRASIGSTSHREERLRAACQAGTDVPPPLPQTGELQIVAIGPPRFVAQQIVEPLQE
jgi:hypothetical protein